MMIPFVHLHVHSQFSVLDGQASVKGLVDKAMADGMRGIALTDHGTMSGIKTFHDYVKGKNAPLLNEIKTIKKELESLPQDAPEKEALQQQINEKQKQCFKPIFGCEVYCARRSRHDKDKNAENPYAPGKSIDRSGWHLILLAKNLTGYHNLCKMVSLSYTEGEYYKPRIDKELLEKHHEGIIATSACLGGEVPQHIMAGQIEKAEETIRWFKSIFGDDYYLEVQLHKTNDPNANRDTYPRQIKVNQIIYDLAEKHQVKVIATNDVHFLNQDDADVHQRMLCVSTKKTIDDPTQMLYSKQEWLKTTEEMNQIFAEEHPEVLVNTLEILDKVELYSIDNPPIMPSFTLPEGFTNDADYLRHLTMEGAKERFGEELSEEVLERLNFELNTIIQMGFPGYFLIVWDFIHYARNNGILVGPGRGSAAGSLVAYCLHIVDINPLRYGLLFERFLNPDRISMPDIDVDFDDQRREEILDYVAEKYGRENVSQIITISTMKAKSAINDMARVGNLPRETSSLISKSFPEKDEKGGAIKNIQQAIDNCEEFKKLAESANPAIAETIHYAQKLEGSIRQMGVHACGVIISGKPINEVVPLATAKDTSGKTVIITQFDCRVIEDTGLIKMDFLGLQTLSIIRKTLDIIKQRHGIDLDIDKIPLDDPATYRLYCEGRTVGTFQFESDGMRQHLINLKPSRFEDLIAMNALYRPGPMAYIPDFIDRKHGRKDIEYDLDIMKEILQETYGITVYQEQVMQLSRKIANFTRGDSDNLRKAMGKKKKDLLDKLESKFFEGGKANGHSEKVLQKIWKDWLAFSEYAFNKSHAAAYSWVAYQTGYLKANYPAEFMAGNLSSVLHEASKVRLFMEECRAMGITVLPPNINESYKIFSVDEQGRIHYGMGAIKGAGSAAIDAIIKERESNGKYTDIYDLIRRLDNRDLNSKTLEALAGAGALDCFGIEREAYTLPCEGDKYPSFIAAIIDYGRRVKGEANMAQISLFGDIEEVQIAKPQPSPCPHFSLLERLKKEAELIGTYVSSNPLDPYRLIIEKMTNITTQEFMEPAALAGQNFAIAGIVTEVSQGMTKKNNPFGRVTIQDMQGNYRFMLFDKDFDDFFNRFHTDGYMFIRGKVQPKRFRKEEFDVKITQVERLSDVAGKLISKVILNIDVESITESFVEVLKKGITENPGNSSLIIQLRDSRTRNFVTLTSVKYKICAGNWLSLLHNKEKLLIDMK